MWGWGRGRRRRKYVRRGGAEHAGSKSRTGSGTDAALRRPVQVPLIMQTMRHSACKRQTLRAARYHYINFSISIQLPVSDLSGAMVGLGTEQRWRLAGSPKLKREQVNKHISSWKYQVQKGAGLTLDTMELSFSDTEHFRPVYHLGIEKLIQKLSSNYILRLKMAFYAPRLALTHQRIIWMRS